MKAQWLRSLTTSLLAFSMLWAAASDTTRVEKQQLQPDLDNGGLTLQKGFGAIVVIDSVGRNRHIAVNPNGDIYIKLERLKNGKGIMVLREDANGKASVVTGFGNYVGTGVAFKNGYLYASSNNDVYRYKLNAKNEVIDSAKPERIITGLINRRQHESKSIALDNAGNIYVNIGAPSNSCQMQDRAKGSLGMDPCPILDSAAGIWQFKVDKLDQSYAEGARYCTGTRNIVGLDWNNDVNELYAMQHGRDDLYRMFPQYFDSVDNSELPAEEFLLVKKGSNFGWPYCYFDQRQDKKVLAPEYGGDGKKTARCEGMERPLIGFPGHWAPNALLFYTGSMFPEKYRNGAFIAFHGSWNRAPLKQAGYNVVFVPMKNGKPNGPFEVFADGFGGVEIIKSTRDAKHRPCGLAQGKDGSIYISDSVKGTVYKIIYTGK
ncbi:MAG TPA: PQQ-dependent sugar dehydrogenase [Chitinophagaceae bacterium]|nr:PQQ-dependent sugar dehydrogenase [Chitinophagaceae bacterium]